MTTTETALFTVRRAGETLTPSLPPFGQFIGGAFVASEFGFNRRCGESGH